MSSIVMFDVRNFSTLSECLAEIKKPRLLRPFIEELLEASHSVVVDLSASLSVKPHILFNHTGDGFVIVFYGPNTSHLALLFACKMSSEAHRIILQHKLKIKDIVNDSVVYNKLKRLNFGIGIHSGAVTTFFYSTSSDGKVRRKKGFIGDSVNVTSRVEQATKDHVVNVICTKDILDNLKTMLRMSPRSPIYKIYFTSLGKHVLKGLDNPKELFAVNANCEKIIHRYLEKNIFLQPLLMAAKG